MSLSQVTSIKNAAKMGLINNMQKTIKYEPAMPRIWNNLELQNKPIEMVEEFYNLV